MHPEKRAAAIPATATAKNANQSKIARLTMPDPIILGKPGIEKKSKVSIKIREDVTVFSPPDDLVSQIVRANTFNNPKYESNELHGYSNWQTAATIETYKRFDGGLSVPRGYLSELVKYCSDQDLRLDIEDLRAAHPVEFPPLKGVTLRPYQIRAVDHALQRDHGVIIAPTGSGKTLIGLEIICKRQQKALIIVHRGELAKQWVEIINERLGIKAGLIGDGSWEIGEEITVAMVQTLAARENETKSLANAFGLVIADECHHAPASTFFDVIGLLVAKYRYGLSATVGRRDGLEQMIYRAIGPALSIITRREVESLGATVPSTVISIRTNFNPGLVSSWNDYLDTLTVNTDRNKLIIDLARQSDGSVLILVDRVAHAEELSKMLSNRNIDHVLAHGKLSKKDRENIIERIKAAKLSIGTTSLLGEGLDVNVWAVLIMAAPISSEIKLMQAIGRIVRPDNNKEKALVYDLKDDCAFAGSSFNKRFEIYKKHKIWVQFTKQ